MTPRERRERVAEITRRLIENEKNRPQRGVIRLGEFVDEKGQTLSSKMPADGGKPAK